jgi:putative transposase
MHVCEGQSGAGVSSDSPGVSTTSALNSVAEQDHRAIKRITRPTLGFKDLHCARVILSGLELMNIIKKGQMKRQGKTPLSPAQQFYSLV